MICSKCGTSDISKFYKCGEQRRYRNLCKDCTKLFIKERRLFLKIKAIKKFGGKCCRCGYDRSLRALEFHHLNGDDKDVCISSMINESSTWLKLEKELNKCILLCSNCHREEHGDISQNQNFSFDHEKLLEGRKRRWEIYNTEYTCKNCGTKFIHKRKKSFCSDECYRAYNRKVVPRPLGEELKKMREFNSFAKIGKMFGVSDTSIRNWILAYEKSK